MMLSTAAKAIRSNCRRLYVPSLHLWYRPIALPTASTTNNHMCWVVQIGISERGLEELGDIDGIKPCKGLTDFVQMDEPLLELEWSGFTIPSSLDDEMHNSVWEKIEGKLKINSPVDGEVDYLINNSIVSSSSDGSDDDNNRHNKDGRPLMIDDDQVLIELRTSRECLQEAIFPLVDKTQYEKFVADIPPGIFGRFPEFRR